MTLPCMCCKRFVASPANMHFDHVDPALKTMKIAYLMMNNIGMASAPPTSAFLNPEERANFETVYDAFFFELTKLAVLCALCHARKTFAELELLFLRDLPSLDARWGVHKV